MTRLRARRCSPHGGYGVQDSLRRFSARAGTDYERYPPIRALPCQCFCSHADLDDCTPLDLLDPDLHPGVVLLAEEDLPHLLPNPLERLTIQRLLRLQTEDVIADLRPVRSGHLPRPQAEDLGLDLL